MKKNKYTTVVFDLGNVLINFDHNLWVVNLNKIENGIGTKMRDFYKKNMHIARDYESGKISDNEFIALNLKLLDYKVSEEEFCRIFSNIFTESNEVTNLLPKLKKNYSLVLLSNTSNIHKKYGWEHYAFLKNFDHFVLSHEIGAIKPDEKIYKAVEDFTNQLPETHIFIDDILENIEAAKKMGWDGIHFTGYSNLVEEFKSKSIL